MGAIEIEEIGGQAGNEADAHGGRCGEYSGRRARCTGTADTSAAAAGGWSGFAGQPRRARPVGRLRIGEEIGGVVAHEVAGEEGDELVATAPRSRPSTIARWRVVPVAVVKVIVAVALATEIARHGARHACGGGDRRDRAAELGGDARRDGRGASMSPLTASSIGGWWIGVCARGEEQEGGDECLSHGESSLHHGVLFNRRIDASISDASSRRIDDSRRGMACHRRRAGARAYASASWPRRTRHSARL